MKFRLLEAKADQEKLINFAGEDLAKRFMNVKSRLKAPLNDIYYWLKKTPEELEAAVSEIENTKTNKEKENIARQGAELIEENETYRVYHINTYEASVMYGKGTQWCISGSKRWSSGVEGGRQYWNNYHNSGDEFYFFLNKNDDKEKYALVLYPGGRRQIFNAEDNTVKSIPNAPYIQGIYVPAGYRNNKWKNLPRMVNARSLGYVFTDPNDFLIDSNGTRLAGFRRDTSGTAVIPDTVTLVDDMAFMGKSRLEKVIVPASVEKMGAFVFSDCPNLEILCKAESMPSGWDPDFNPDNRPVVWGYKDESDAQVEDEPVDVEVIDRL